VTDRAYALHALRADGQSNVLASHQCKNKSTLFIVDAQQKDLNARAKIWPDSKYRDGLEE